MYKIVTPNHTFTYTRSDLMWLGLIVVWEIAWKGIALWKAGRNKQLGWFVVMLILNTLGILEIVYLIFFAKRNDPEQPG